MAGEKGEPGPGSEGGTTSDLALLSWARGRRQGNGAMVLVAPGLYFGNKQHDSSGSSEVVSLHLNGQVMANLCPFMGMCLRRWRCLFTKKNVEIETSSKSSSQVR